MFPSLSHTHHTLKLKRNLKLKHPQISFDMRYLATTVSHVFLAFGELLDLYKRVVEISGYASRVIEVERGLLAIQAKQDVTKTTPASALPACLRSLPANLVATVSVTRGLYATLLDAWC